MRITDTHTVTPGEASYEVTKALLPFLIEAGTPVYICRDGWALAVSSSIGGPPNWTDLVYALDIMESISDSEGWARAIRRDDGVIFLVDLGHVQREAVQVVL